MDSGVSLEVGAEKPQAVYWVARRKTATSENKAEGSRNFGCAVNYRPISLPFAVPGITASFLILPDFMVS